MQENDKWKDKRAVQNLSKNGDTKMKCHFYYHSLIKESKYHLTLYKRIIYG